MILNLDLAGAPQDVRICRLIIAGWAGRDPAAVQAHIHELAEIGVAPPSATPLFYRIAAARLTTAEVIECLGAGSSGEVEIALLNAAGALWVGVGSDHTDRVAEAHGVALSKQLCDKPLGRTFWRQDEVAAHWDELMLRSYIEKDGARIPYQTGSASSLLAPGRLLERLGGPLEDGDVMFCGTVPTLGGVVAAETLTLELHDPILRRTLSHSYRSLALPIVS